MKSIKYLLGLVVMAFVLHGALAGAQVYQVNYTVGSGSSSSASFAVQTLKYSPFPANPGDWFDLWIQVQNVGQSDAKNVKFQILQTYPFSSDDGVKSFGFIYGVSNSYQIGMGGNANTVLLDYRIKVADNAPEGVSNLTLLVGVNGNDPSTNGYGISLPISIAETKTDFDVVSQGSSGQGTSFAISNIGSNAATAITVTFNSGRGPSQSSIIGNLNAGDFTTVTFPALSAGNSTAGAGARRNSASNESFQNFQNRTSSPQMIIAYTDIAGVRSTVTKNLTIIPVSSSSFAGATRTTAASSSWSVYIYLILGVIIGVVLVFIYQKIKRKK